LARNVPNWAYIPILEIQALNDGNLSSVGKAVYLLGGLHRYAADGLFYTRDLTIGTAYGRWC